MLLRIDGDQLPHQECAMSRRIAVEIASRLTTSRLAEHLHQSTPMRRYCTFSSGSSQSPTSTSRQSIILLTGGDTGRGYGGGSNVGHRVLAGRQANKAGFASSIGSTQKDASACAATICAVATEIPGR
jgi:hypothetical protein